MFLLTRLLPLWLGWNWNFSSTAALTLASQFHFHPQSSLSLVGLGQSDPVNVRLSPQPRNYGHLTPNFCSVYCLYINYFSDLLRAFATIEPRMSEGHLVKESYDFYNPVLLGCPNCWHIAVRSSLMILCIGLVSVVTSPLSFLILFILSLLFSPITSYLWNWQSMFSPVSPIRQLYYFMAI